MSLIVEHGMLLYRFHEGAIQCAAPESMAWVTSGYDDWTPAEIEDMSQHPLMPLFRRKYRQLTYDDPEGM